MRQNKRKIGVITDFSNRKDDSIFLKEEPLLNIKGSSRYL